MAWPESLSAAQQAAIQNFVDQDFRPTILSFGKTFSGTQIRLIPQYLSSPSGLTSTIASPAADSVAGLLAALPGADMIPIINSGLPLIGPLPVSKVISYCSTLNTMLATYWTAAIQQDLAQMVGSINITGS